MGQPIRHPPVSPPVTPWVTPGCRRLLPTQGRAGLAADRQWIARMLAEKTVG
jgi:hypothetical protein